METDQRARLLIVDDEPKIRAGLRDLLTLMGYCVEEAGSGREALERLDSASYDLMVLDIRMPVMDGVEVMNHTRHKHPDLPIIVLTAHASLESAIAAVRSGAVDYLHKPIDIEDLTTTISKTLRKRAELARRQLVLDMIGEALDTLHQTDDATAEAVFSTSSIDEPLPSPEPLLPTLNRFLSTGPLTLDRQKRLVVVKGESSRTVELTEGEAAILATLMEHSNQVLSCVQLARAAMGCDLAKQDAQSIVRPSIHRLRRKVEADPATPRLIHTVRGRGYFFSPA